MFVRSAWTAGQCVCVCVCVYKRELCLFFGLLLESVWSANRRWKCFGSAVGGAPQSLGQKLSWEHEFKSRSQIQLPWVDQRYTRIHSSMECIQNLFPKFFVKFFFLAKIFLLNFYCTSLRPCAMCCHFWSIHFCGRHRRPTRLTTVTGTFEMIFCAVHK